MWISYYHQKVARKWKLNLLAKKLLPEKSNGKMEIGDSENYTYILISSIEYYFSCTRVRARYGPTEKIVHNAAYNDSCI